MICASKYAAKNNDAPLSTAIIKTIAESVSNELKTVNAITARMSWTKSIPMTILPCKESICFLSDNILMTTNVEENAMTNPKYDACKGPNPKKIVAAKPMIKVANTWINPPNDAIFPMLLIRSKSNSKPTMNSKKAIPPTPSR